MPGYIKAGRRINLACSCRAEVVLSLALVGAHRHFTVRIVQKGERCHHSHHRTGQRTVVRQAGTRDRPSFKDALK